MMAYTMPNAEIVFSGYFDKVYNGCMVVELNEGSNPLG